MENGIDNIWEWNIQQRLNKPRRCELCRSVDLARNMVNLTRNDVPGAIAGFYHPRCADEVKEKYQKICVICNEKYTMLREDGNTEICPKCDKGEYRRMQTILESQLREARKHDLPATLTMKEWLETLDYFDWSCAYCGHKPFVILEHFVPISKRGGTTKNNCVPACYSCNMLKKDKNPFYSNVGNLYKISRYLKGRA
jgi:5-methylcytosine-specific restriction endonuclease McrA